MEYGRRGVGRDGVHEKPGAPAGGRDCARVFRGGAATGGGAGAVVGGALHGGWDANRGLGESAEFSGEEGAAGARDGERRAADVARHARKPDGSGSAAVQEERGGRSETQLFGTPGDGKPEWADCEIVCDAIGDAGRTAGSLGDDGTDREEGEGEGEGGGRKGIHVGSGQGLSEEGID